MKILILGNTIDRIEYVNDFCSLCAFYLQKYLKINNIEVYYHRVDTTLHSKDLEIQIDYFKNNILYQENTDHIIAIPIRFFSLYSNEIYKILKSKISGYVCQFYDTTRPQDRCDITFFFSDRNGHNKGCYINWAADNEILYPEKNENYLSILIDHGMYQWKPVKNDLSDVIANDVYKFMNNRILLNNLNIKYNKKFKEVKVHRLISDGIEDFNINTITKNNYNKNGLPYIEVCKEYRKADLFIVTHPESLGMSTIECAMTGSLILCPEGYISNDRINLLNHIKFNDKIDDNIWDNIFNNLNIQDNKERVRNYTWKNAINTLINRLKS
jgi:hypothetical protein